MRPLTPSLALILSTTLLGCSKSIDILPLVKSVTVTDGQVTVLPYPSSAHLDGQPVASDSPIPMHPGQALQLTDPAQVCTYKLVQTNGDTAQFRQTTSIRQPNGHWHHDSIRVNVAKHIGEPPGGSPSLPPQQ